jgi:hypothetical protein
MPDYGAEILTLAEQGAPAVREQVASERSKTCVSEMAI